MLPPFEDKMEAQCTTMRSSPASRALGRTRRTLPHFLFAIRCHLPWIHDPPGNDITPGWLGTPSLFTSSTMKHIRIPEESL